MHVCVCAYVFDDWMADMHIYAYMYPLTMISSYDALRVSIIMLCVYRWNMIILCNILNDKVIIV